jgi:tRNA threonylcarbamoyladenosine modification (KEOPS) complex  Pcc1 subunit
MKFKVILEADLDSSFLKTIIKESEKKDRSDIKIKRKNNKIIFNIVAKDIIALKAAVNRVIKSIIIYEKTKVILKCQTITKK